MFRTSWGALCATLALVLIAQARADDPSPAEPESPPPAAVDEPKFDLKYKFKTGESVRTEIVHRATVQTTIQGTSQTAETQSTSVKCWRVDKIATDGTVTFTHLVESLDMWQKTQGRTEIRYNSQTDTEVPPGYEQVADAVGVSLTVVTMDERGKVLKRVEKRSQPMGMSTQITMPLPGEPVAIGTSWSSPLDIDVTLKDGSTKKMNTRQKFTLEKVEGDVATIAVDSQILSPIPDPAIEAQLIQRLTAGTVRFDINEGRVISQQLDLDRHVIGFSGPASSMHYVTRFTERLLGPGELVVQRAKRGEPAKKADGEAARQKSPPRR